MSFAAGQARLMLLISEQYDFELKMQFLSQQKHYLASSVTGFMNLRVQYEPNSQQDKLLQAKIHELSKAEEFLAREMENLRKRIDAVGQERESLSKSIEKSTREFGNAWSSQ